MENTLLTSFGSRLRELRQESGATQKAMAAYLGCTASNYQKMEYGEVNVPLTTLAALAQYFHVSSDYLLGLSDARECDPR